MCDSTVHRSLYFKKNFRNCDFWMRRVADRYLLRWDYHHAKNWKDEGDEVANRNIKKQSDFGTLSVGSGQEICRGLAR
jgi:hypothetical protein